VHACGAKEGSEGKHKQRWGKGGERRLKQGEITPEASRIERRKEWTEGYAVVASTNLCGYGV
jgi:hypothetical protein